MKKAILLIIIAVITLSTLTTLQAQVKTIAQFDLPLKDPFVVMDSKHLYIFDRTTRKINIFSRPGFKKIAQFGKRGEGPGEFIAINSMYVTGDSLMVNSYPKISLFSKTGRFLEQLKCPVNVGSFIPLGNNYIGRSYRTDRKTNKTTISYHLLDAQLKLKKEIYAGEMDGRMSRSGNKTSIRLYAPTIRAVPYKNKLYIGATNKGFYFSVFNPDGNPLHQISKEHTPRKVTDAEKKLVLEGIRKGIGQQEWERRKAMFNYVFPDHYPAFASFAVDDGRIFVFHFPHTQTQDITILNLKGELLKKKTIPALKRRSIIERHKYFMSMGRLYFLEDDPDKEIWELKTVQLD